MSAIKIDRRKAPQTKERILDAAEALFAQRGYYGVSLRDITQAAGVRLALAHYHFGSKEELFRSVIDRRADDNAAGLRQALDAVVASAGDSPPRINAILHAFLEPVVERSLRGGEGWKNYIRLMAQVANLPREETFSVPANARYDAVVGDYIAQLRRALPDVPAVDVQWSFYFFQAAIIHMLIETGLVDRQSDGLCHSSDLDTIVEKMTRFFASGFRGLGGSFQ